MKRMASMIFLAGICGGFAEVIWIAIYGAASQTSSLEVARQITASVFPAMADSLMAAQLGIVIHMLLAVLLTGIFVWAVWLPYTRRAHRLNFLQAMLISVTTLSAVWAINFFVILPQLNPAFIGLMPLGVTLLSKMLFGVAMGGVLGQVARAAAPYAADDAATGR